MNPVKHASPANSTYCEIELGGNDHGANGVGVGGEGGGRNCSIAPSVCFVIVYVLLWLVQA